MNRASAQRIFAELIMKISKNGTKKDLQKLLIKGAEELGIQDPFAFEIDEYLMEKAGEDPEQQAYDEYEDQTGDNIEEIKDENEQDSPQDQLEKEVEKEVEKETDTEKPDSEDKEKDNEPEDSVDKKDSAEPKAEPKKSSNEDSNDGKSKESVESQFRKIAKEISDRGRPDLAHELVLATTKIEIVEMLNSLLVEEYLQRDLYESYSYLLFGPESIAVQDHLKEHLDQEMKHIEILQRYVVDLGGTPTLERKPLDKVEPRLKNILEMDLRYEESAVDNYAKTISFLENIEEYTALKVDIENILAEEQEHVHDIKRWLETL